MYIGQTGGNQLELMVEGYQHEDFSQNFFEANWLRIALAVRTPDTMWRAKAPAILSNELDTFLDWLQSLRANSGQKRFFDFEDPTLYVCVLEQDAHELTLEFHLHLDFRRPQEDKNETRVAITMNYQELDSWIRHLKQFSEAYPVRYIIGL